MSFRTSYLRALRREFRGSAPIFPKAEILELGDYGIYQNGKFTESGNIFKDLELDLNEFKNGENAIASEIIMSENAFQTGILGDATLSGSEISLNIKFESQSAYVLQLIQYTTESFSLSQEILNALKTNLAELGWRTKFRIVQSRLICEKLYFAYSMAADGNLVLKGKMPESLQIGEANLIVSASHKVNGSSWIDTGHATPVVDFVSLRRKDKVFIPHGPGIFKLSSGGNAMVNPDDDFILAIDNFDEDFEGGEEGEGHPV